MSLHVEISQGLRVDDLVGLQAQVRLRGGRLVAYSEVISAILISARSYPVRWIPAIEERKDSAIRSNIISALLGWWAISGPYWTITAFIWNQRGGFDVTDALLRANPGNSSLLGYSDAIALATFQESASRLALRIYIVIITIFLSALAYIVWSVSRK